MLMKRGTKLYGKDTQYEVVKVLPYSCDNEVGYYLCRNDTGGHVIMQTCLDDVVFEWVGHRSLRMKGVKLGNLRFPDCFEIVSTHMSSDIRRSMILELDVEDVSRLIPLPTFFERKKWFDTPTVIWLMRELLLMWDSPLLCGSDDYVYAGGVLVDPETKCLVVYDFMHQYLDATRKDPKECLRQSLSKLCLEVLSCGMDTFAYSFELEKKYQSVDLNRLIELLTFDEQSQEIPEIVRKLSEDLEVERCPFRVREI